MRYTAGGEPARHPLLTALEADAVDLLRTKGQHGKAMDKRLNARHYLLTIGWTVEQVNEAAEQEED